ncbi:MAG: VOC family protein [Methanomassiliicoccales archaeon]
MIESMMDVAVMVADASASAKWYKEKLGFEIFSSDGHWITVGPKGSATVLHLCEGQREPGNTGIAFTVDDLDKTYKELSSKGVRFTQSPADRGFGPFARFEDPDGNEFWLFPK